MTSKGTDHVRGWECFGRPLASSYNGARSVVLFWPLKMKRQSFLISIFSCFFFFSLFHSPHSLYRDKSDVTSECEWRGMNWQKKVKKFDTDGQMLRHIYRGAGMLFFCLFRRSKLPRTFLLVKWCIWYRQKLIWNWSVVWRRRSDATYQTRIDRQRTARDLFIPSWSLWISKCVGIKLFSSLFLLYVAFVIVLTNSFKIVHAFFIFLIDFYKLKNCKWILKFKS